MATDQLDWHSRVRDTGPGWGRYLFGPLSAVLTFYMVALSLICMDEFFLNHRLILEPMRTYTPDLVDPFCSACMAVYWPLTQIMHALQIQR
ncbi:MAG: hypothetical protein JWN70_1818 [Planctomycetaceae bacterium]|nr:hypothetical protein [Planctomycetaceae bacterium]